MQEFGIKHFLLTFVNELISQDLTEVREFFAFLEETSTVDYFNCDYSILKGYFFAVNPSVDIIKDV